MLDVALNNHHEQFHERLSILWRREVVVLMHRQTKTLIKQMTAPHQAREPMSTVELPHVQYKHGFNVRTSHLWHTTSHEIPTPMIQKLYMHLKVANKLRVDSQLMGLSGSLAMTEAILLDQLPRGPNAPSLALGGSVKQQVLCLLAMLVVHACVAF